MVVVVTGSTSPSPPPPPPEALPAGVVVVVVAGFIVSVNCSGVDETGGTDESVAVTVTVKVRAVLGVPKIRPPGESVSPGAIR